MVAYEDSATLIPKLLTPEIELDVISKFLLPGNDLLKIEIPLLKAPEILLFLITFFLLAQILMPLIPSLAEE